MRKLLSIILILIVFQTAQAVAEKLPLPAAYQPAWLPPEPLLSAISDKNMSTQRLAGYEALKNTNIPIETGIAHYVAVTGVLSSSNDIVPARAMYMEIMRELAYLSVYRGKELATDEMIEGAISLAKTDSEKSLAHFLAGWNLSESPFVQQRARAGAEFAQADKIQPAAMREQMLLRYALWAERDGLSTIAGEGAISTEGDYKKALELYDILAKIATDASISTYADASAKNIRAPFLQNSIAYAFRSGSQVQFTVNSRNCAQIDVSVYRMELGEIPIALKEASPEALAQAIKVPEGNEPVRRLSLTKAPDHPHCDVSSEIRLDSLLMPGAYLVTTASGELRHNQILLVTDNVLALKASRRQILAFSCNAATGKPVPNSTVTIWIRQNKNSDQWYRAAKKSDDNGVAFFEASELGSPRDTSECDVVAFSVSDQQETMAFFSPAGADLTNDSWTSITIPDSLDYAAGSKVCIRSLVRRRENGQFIIPSNSRITVRITGIDAPTFHPNEFAAVVEPSGAATTSFTIPQNAAQGTYSVALVDTRTGEEIGDRSYFAIVARDVPDVAVDIVLSKRDDDAGYEVGETIRGCLKAVSSSGLPEVSRDISLVVEARTFDFSDGAGGVWKESSKTPLRTDSKGEAPFTIQTAASLQNDFEYRVTAITRDRDGRVSKASTNFFAARQDMYARLTIAKSLYEENQPLELKLETTSSSGIPKEAKGTLRLLKESWQETWIDRRGHEISGDEMQTLRRKGSGWFSFGQSVGDYTLKSQGYATETIAEIDLSTDKTGRASYKLARVQPGYYRFVWVADGRRGTIISNETPFWVSGGTTDVSGYRPDKIQIIVNPSSPAGDNNSSALISVPSPDQNVLLIYGSDTIDSWSVMAMKGTTYLAKASSAPNGFDSFLEATCVNDEKGNVASAKLRSNAPRYLTVSIESDDSSYLPGSQADFKVYVRDVSGKPVAGAHLFFWLSGSDVSGCKASLTNLFSAEKTSFNLKSSFSTDATPFFQPSMPIQASFTQQKAGHESETHPADDIGSTFPANRTARATFGMEELVTGEDGTAIAHAKGLPSMKASWWATVLATHENGSAGFTTKKIATNEDLSVAMSFADEVYEGDAIEILASLTNNDESDVNAECAIESEGLTPSNPVFDSRLAEMAPGKSAAVSWTASYPDQGEAQIIFTAKIEGRSHRIKCPLLVKPASWLKKSTTSKLLDGDGVISIVQPAENDAHTETVCRISASPSRVTLASLPYLLNDPSTGSSEASARLAVVCSLRKMFEEMHYGEVMIDEAMQGESVSDYFSQRIDSDVDVVLADQGKSGAWGWTNPQRENAFVTAWNMIMLDFCEDKIREKLSPAMNAARDYAASAIVSEGQPPDVQAILLLGIANRDRSKTHPTRLEAKALVNLIRIQDKLNVFALGCLALSADKYGFDEEARKIVSLVKSKALAERDDENARVIKWTASASSGGLLMSEVENTAMAAMAIIAVNGTKDEFVEPAIRFIYGKSIEGHWDGPRETALCIMAIDATAAYGAEADIDASCELFLGGVKSGGYNSSTEKPLVPPKRILLADASAKNNKLEIKRISGASPLFISLENTWKSGSNAAFSKLPDLVLSRKFKQTKQVPTLLEGFNEKVIDLNSSMPLSLGERIESIVIIDSRKPIQMLLVRSPRPSFSKWHAQSAPAEIVSADGAVLDAENVEQTNLPDALYVSIENLPPGRWEIRTFHTSDYPGEFVMPAASAWIPQRPTLRAESDTIKLKCVR